MESVMQQEGYDLIGAAIEVYNEKGPGFLEEVYQECLEIELAARGIPFVSQQGLTIFYKKQPIQKKYKPDLMVFGEIVVELKAIKKLGNEEYAQIINYLKATGKRVGYLINFGCSGELEWKRFIL